MGLFRRVVFHHGGVPENSPLTLMGPIFRPFFPLFAGAWGQNPFFGHFFPFRVGGPFSGLYRAIGIATLALPRPSIPVCSLEKPNPLNKEVRPFFLSDNSIWSFPSIFSLSDYSI